MYYFSFFKTIMGSLNVQLDQQNHIDGCENVKNVQYYVQNWHFQPRNHV